jgi:hypothetical protein
MNGKSLKVVAVCGLAVIAALLVVGAVSHGVIRHIVQTAPLWIAIAMGFRGSRWTKWAALPCFLFWLLLMTLIWLFLLGWVHILSGTFSPTEIAMTLIVGAASVMGITTSVRTQSGGAPWPAAGLIALVAALQLIALRVSFLPEIGHR